MKNFIFVSLVLATTVAAHAEPVRLVSGDGSAFSAICIAAVISRDEMFDKAAELGIAALDAASLRCNGKPIGRFAAQIRHQMQMPLPAGSYRFNPGDASAVTALCVAAAKSEAEYVAAKEQYFAADPEVEAEVMCNGMALDDFARRYRAPQQSISQR
jgi:hypothetical protein